MTGSGPPEGGYGCVAGSNAAMDGAGGGTPIDPREIHSRHNHQSRIEYARAPPVGGMFGAGSGPGPVPGLPRGCPLKLDDHDQWRARGYDCAIVHDVKGQQDDVIEHVSVPDAESKVDERAVAELHDGLGSDRVRGAIARTLEHPYTTQQ